MAYSIAECCSVDSSETSPGHLHKSQSEGNANSFLRDPNRDEESEQVLHPVRNDLETGISTMKVMNDRSVINTVGKHVPNIKTSTKSTGSRKSNFLFRKLPTGGSYQAKPGVDESVPQIVTTSSNIKLNFKKLRFKKNIQIISTTKTEVRPSKSMPTFCNSETKTPEFQNSTILNTKKKCIYHSPMPQNKRYNEKGEEPHNCEVSQSSVVCTRFRRTASYDAAPNNVHSVRASTTPVEKNKQVRRASSANPSSTPTTNRIIRSTKCRSAISPFASPLATPKCNSGMRRSRINSLKEMISSPTWPTTFVSPFVTGLNSSDIPLTSRLTMKQLPRVRSYEGSGLTIRIPRHLSDKGPVNDRTTRAATMSPTLQPPNESTSRIVSKSRSLTTSMDKLSSVQHRPPSRGSSSRESSVTGSRGSTPSSTRSTTVISRPPSRRSVQNCRSPRTPERSTPDSDTDRAGKTDSPTGSEISVHSTQSVPSTGLSNASPKSPRSSPSRTLGHSCAGGLARSSSEPPSGNPISRTSAKRLPKSKSPLPTHSSVANVAKSVPLTPTKKSASASSLSSVGENGFDETGNSSPKAMSRRSTPSRQTPPRTPNSGSNSSTQRHSIGSTPNKKSLPVFNSYMSLFQVQERLKKGEVIEGVLRINPKNYEDAYISAPDGEMDIFIGGVLDRNAALHGDIVAVEMNPLEEWKILYDQLDTYLDDNIEHKTLVYKPFDKGCFNAENFLYLKSSCSNTNIRPTEIDKNMCNKNKDNIVDDPDVIIEEISDDIVIDLAIPLESLKESTVVGHKENISTVNSTEEKSSSNIQKQNVDKMKNRKVSGAESINAQDCQENIKLESTLTESPNKETLSVNSKQKKIRRGCRGHAKNQEVNEKPSLDGFQITNIKAEDAHGENKYDDKNQICLDSMGQNKPKAKRREGKKTKRVKVIEALKLSFPDNNDQSLHGSNSLIPDSPMIHIDGVSSSTKSQITENITKSQVVTLDELSECESSDGDNDSVHSFTLRDRIDIKEDACVLSLNTDLSTKNLVPATMPIEQENEGNVQLNQIVCDDMQTLSINDKTDKLQPTAFSNVKPLTNLRNNSTGSKNIQHRNCASDKKFGEELSPLNAVTNQHSSFPSDNKAVNNNPMANQKVSNGRRISHRFNAERTEPNVLQICEGLDNWKQFVQRTAKVVYIMEKKHKRMAAGILKMFPDMNQNHALFSPVDSRIPRMKIPMSQCPPEFKVRNADYAKVIFLARLVTWTNQKFAFGELVEIIGNVGDIVAETAAMLQENSVDDSPFPEATLCDLPQLPWVIPPEEHARRRDLRELLIVTIDPATARDLDDAVSCIPLPSGNYRVGVHIADVSYFVKPDTLVDTIASERGTTVYLTDKVIPMLPRPLCEDLCSLNPGKDKLALSVIWDLTAEGDVLEKWIGRTVIRSCVKLAYEHAQSMIENPDSFNAPEEFPPIADEHKLSSICKVIHDLHLIAVKLRKKREVEGALRLDQPKVCFSLNAESKMPNGIFTYEQKDSNRLIEEFMLLANITVAETIYYHFPLISVLRQHPPPHKFPMNNTIKLLHQHGIHLDPTTSGTLSASLKRYAGHTAKSQARMQLIVNLCSKPMQYAKYFCTGVVREEKLFHHYALNVSKYTHFTSPIRRYPDILVHRLLIAAVDPVHYPAPQWNAIEVGKIATHCNEKKQAAKIVQEVSCDLYLALFIQSVGEMIEKASVIAVLDKSLDVLITRLGIVKRCYLDKLPLNGSRFIQRNKISSLIIEWRGNEQLNLPPYAHTLTYFDPVRVSLRPFENDSLKFNAILLRPDLPTLVDDL